MKAGETLEQVVRDFLRERGRNPQLTPEEFCRDSPGRLPVLQQLLQAVTTTNDQASTSALPTADRPVPPTADLPENLGVYVFQRKLGEGGMGSVYLAADTRLDRPVALKVMRPEIASQPLARARFLREAKAMAAVRHEHVAAIHAANEEPDGRTWLAMELLEGQALDDALNNQTPMDWKTILRIGREVALGLSAAHAKKLIHRDIKPANIWLESPGGKVKLLDFGLARQVESAEEVTGSGALIGTPSHMAPEQANGDPVDHRCDLFSLGVVLYRLVTGKLPFHGPTVMATLSALANHEPTPVGSLRPDCPRGLAKLIHQLLAKDREQRPASALAVADELRRLETDGDWTPVSATPVMEPTVAMNRVDRPVPKRSFPVWLLLLLPLMCCVPAGLLGGFFLLQHDPSRPQADIEHANQPREATPSPSPDATRAGNDRQAAEYVISVGGKLRVKGGTAEIDTVDKLPRDPFHLTTIDFFHNERVTDEGLGVCQGCDHLTHLFLNSTNVGDAGLANFKDCKTFRELHLWDTKITDAGLVHFKGCRELNMLFLTGTQVSDAGLPVLKDFKKLASLHLIQTKVTAAGVEELKKALPMCEIFWDAPK